MRRRAHRSARVSSRDEESLRRLFNTDPQIGSVAELLVYLRAGLPAQPLATEP